MCPHSPRPSPLLPRVHCACIATCLQYNEDKVQILEPRLDILHEGLGRHASRAVAPRWKWKREMKKAQGREPSPPCSRLAYPAAPGGDPAAWVPLAKPSGEVRHKLPWGPRTSRSELKRSPGKTRLRGWTALSVGMPSGSRSEAGGEAAGAPSGTRCRARGRNPTPRALPAPRPRTPSSPGPSPGPRAAHHPPTHHPPTQPAGGTVHAAEPPAGGARGLAAAGCCRVERGSAHIPGSVP